MKETIDLLGKILTNILTALYEPFGFSLLLSFLAMFFYLYAYEPYMTNSIKESKSYFLQSGEGFVFLFEIYHGDPQAASSLDNTIGLMVKINSVLPLNSLLGYTESMQEEMEKLKLLVENYLEEKYCYPDVLYSFMDKVLDDKTE